MKIDYVTFVLPDPSNQCLIRDGATGNKYNKDDVFTTREYAGTEYTHVHISFISADGDDTLLALTDPACGTITQQSGNGLAVWAEFRIPTADCEFDWKLTPEAPPCVLKIVIKKS